nr:DUF2577 family protein [uncultured Tyzzerella sp.]
MNFFNIIKSSVLHILSSIKFVETYIGEVVEEENLKIKLDEKLFITENEIIRTSSFSGIIKKGTKIFIIRENGGQRFFLIDTIFEQKND